MSNAGPKPTPSRSRVQNGGRQEPTAGEVRPFAEVRRTLDDVLHIATLHRWAFLVPFCLVTSATFVASLYYPRMYTASTTFERRNDPVMIDLPLSAGAASFDYFRSTMTSDIKSLENMRDVVENLGLGKNLPRDPDGRLTPEGERQRDAIAVSLASRLTVGRRSPDKQIDVIGITYLGPDRETGPALVDEVKQVYIRRTMAQIEDFLRRQREYFQQEADTALAQLHAAQRKLTRIRLENPYANPSDPSALSMRLSQMEMERRELLLRKREYAAELNALRQALEQLESTIGVADAVANRAGESVAPMYISEQARVLQAQLDAVDKQLETWRVQNGMTDLHPKIVALRAERKRLAAALHQELAAPTKAVNEPHFAGLPPAPVIAQSPWHGELTRLKAQIAAQERKIGEVETSLQTNRQTIEKLAEAKDMLFENQEHFDAIQEEVNKGRQHHNHLQSVLMSIDPAINAVSQDRLMQFSPGEPARGSARPSSPKVTTILLLGLLAGGAAGVGCVILAEVLDDVYRTSGHVARSLGLPILDAVDEIVTSRDRRQILVRRLVSAPLALALLLATTGLTGSMAYLSLQKPSAYERVRRIPQAAANLLGVEQDRSNEAAEFGP